MKFQAGRSKGAAVQPRKAWFGEEFP